MPSIPNAEDLYQILLKQLKEQQAINSNFQLAGLASGEIGRASCRERVSSPV